MPSHRAFVTVSILILALCVVAQSATSQIVMPSKERGDFVKDRAKAAREDAEQPKARPWDRDASGRRPWDAGYLAPDPPTTSSLKR